MRPLVKLNEETLEKIGDYVKKKLPEWSRELSLVQGDPSFQKQTLLNEKELLHQRELMQSGFDQVNKRIEQVDKKFDQVDKRFEQVDKRFEQVDKRFEQVDKRFEQVDKRFEEQLSLIKIGFAQVDRRFERVYDFMKWQIGLGFVMVMGIYVKLYLG